MARLALLLFGPSATTLDGAPITGFEFVSRSGYTQGSG
jgi:hypothetical protein